MKRNFVFKKCNRCGALVEVLNDCNCENCGIQCCGEQMVELKENFVDCAKEKHIPNYQVVGNYIYVFVSHVMEGEHYIEWVAINSDKLTAKKFFKEGEEAVAVFPYIKGSKIFAYCNKHGLWSNEIK